MWDFIIVGGGTAGCVLAHELTVSGRHRVLLVEAGGKPPLMSRIPAGMPKLFGSRQDWGFESEPNRSCGGRRVYVPRGRMLGGSGAMNAQIHQWCHPEDFAEWAESGLRQWGWDQVAPVFRDMETLRNGPPSRGAGGPMMVETPASASPLPKLWVAAAHEAGLVGTDSYNGVAFRGAWMTEQAHRKGQRFSVYDAYLKPALRRRNLTLISGHTVDRVTFSAGRATGIALRGGERHEAARSVVLSAGAYGSPHLLMRSGIGAGEDLQRHGIEVIIERPEVGCNLQDHSLLGLQFHLRRRISLRRAGSLGQLIRWLLFRKGLLATSGIDAFAFESTRGEGAPDLELILAPFEVRNQLREEPEVEAFAIAAAVLKPRSRGTVSLRSDRSGDAPAIDLNLFSDAAGEDRRVAVAGLRLARAIASTAPLAAEVTGEFAGTRGIEKEDELFEAALPLLQTVYHPCGTCRMGTDAEAVLDARLRVRGIDGLRVVDASAMPSVPRGHPNAVVAMMAKRASEMIISEVAAA